jgi:VWFA-related protein
LHPQGLGRLGGVREEKIPVNLGLKALALTAILSSASVLSTAAVAQQPQDTPQAVPDAPAPQAPAPLTNLGPITPGIGAGNASPTSSSTADQPQAPSSRAPSQVKDQLQTAPPETGNIEEIGAKLVLNATYVEIPVTVKDPKGKPVAGLTWRDFRVFENDTREQIRIFSVDPAQMSVAFVIDQSLTADVMVKVNRSLDALQGALSPYDEVAVFTYNNGAQERTSFTGAQSSRLPAVLALAREEGRDPLVPINGGPFGGCSITKNGGCVDPNVQEGRSVGNPSFITIPKEIHTLNDAILAAAKELSTRPKGRRRVIYVVSDGKEYGSKATYKDVLRYLQTNKIAVYGTLVGDSARWGVGYVSRFHLPFTMYDNRLVGYVQGTGGILESQNDSDGIEKSYARIADEARNQYTLVYASHEPLIDGKYRRIEVRVDRPGVEVIAKKGYYPSGQDQK